MMKIAMLKVHNFMFENNLKSKMMLQVHDELVFEAHIEELDYLRSNVTSLMEAALPLGEVPVVVETGTGKNWFEAH
jgi:DNA polymerase-1